MATLGELNSGTRATILDVQVDGEVGQRLLSLGMAEGAPIEVVRQAPLNDPLQVRCGGVSFAIRRRDANLIRVEPLAAAP